MTAIIFMIVTLNIPARVNNVACWSQVSWAPCIRRIWIYKTFLQKKLVLHAMPKANAKSICVRLAKLWCDTHI